MIIYKVFDAYDSFFQNTILQNWVLLFAVLSLGALQ